MEQIYSTYGKEEAVDLWGVEGYLLDDIEFIENMCKEAIIKTGANLVGEVKHKFTPQGCTLLFLLSESHLSIHTSPEKGYAAVNCFTCGTHTKPEKAIEYIVDALNPDIDRCKFWTLIRGVE